MKLSLYTGKIERVFIQLTLVAVSKVRQHHGRQKVLRSGSTLFVCHDGGAP